MIRFLLSNILSDHIFFFVTCPMCLYFLILFLNNIVHATVYPILLHTPRFLLEIRVINKILKNPCYPINIGRFSLGKSKKNIFFSKKKIQNGRLKKTSFSSSANSQYFFMKISWIGP